MVLFVSWFPVAHVRLQHFFQSRGRLSGSGNVGVRAIGKISVIQPVGRIDVVDRGIGHYFYSLSYIVSVISIAMEWTKSEKDGPRTVLSDFLQQSDVGLNELVRGSGFVVRPQVDD